MIEHLRAFGVTVGPSIAADVTAAACVAATIRSLHGGRRPRTAALAGTVVTAAYVAAARPWMHRHLSTEVDAPPEAVWPWLAQIGQDRAGFYSFEWLENLAGCRMHNADELHPEWQHRHVGEKVWLHPSIGLPVTRFDPPRALGIEGWGTFELERLPGGRTRLSERRVPPHGPGRLADALLIEIPHFVMERWMFAGIKCRAECARS